MPVDEAVMDEVAAAESEAPEVEGSESAEPENDPNSDMLGEQEEGDQEESEGDPEEPEVGKEQSYDGRKMPDALKRGIAALKASNPDAAKEVKGLFFANQEYRNVFPKPEDGVAAKTFIDQLGGPDGLKQIEAERTEWSQLDRQYAEAPKDFVKTIAENNPDAFMKIAPQAVNEWASRAPEEYGHYANQVAFNTVMSQPGVQQSLPALKELHAQLASAPWAQQAVAAVHDAIVGLKQQTTQYEQRRPDPREAQLKQRETQFEQRRRADFEVGVANQAESYLGEKMQPEIDRVLGGRKLDAEAAPNVQKWVNAEVMRMLGEVPQFEQQLEAFYRTGDAQKSLDYIKTQYNRILPEAVKKVVAPLYRNIQASAPTRKGPQAIAGKPAEAGQVVLKEMPDWDQVDASKTTVADMIQGKAVLKNGKRASGWA